MIAFTERNASGLVQTFRGLARRSVVIASADVYRGYGRTTGRGSHGLGLIRQETVVHSLSLAIELIGENTGVR